MNYSPRAPRDASSCRRRIVSEIRGLPWRNPAPAVDPGAENRRRIASHAVSIIISELKCQGWQPNADHTSSRLDVSPDSAASELILQLPRHQAWTSPHGTEPDTLLLFRVPGPDTRERIERRGVGEVYYDDIAAIAAANHHGLAVGVAMYHTGTGLVSLAIVPSYFVDGMRARWSAALATTLSEAFDLTEPVPDPERGYNHPECRSCRFRVGCPSQTPPTAPEVDFNDQEFEDLLNEWLRCDAAVKAVSSADKSKETLKQRMMALLDAAGMTAISVYDQEDNLREVSVSSYQRNVPNLKAMQSLMSPDQFREMVPQASTRRFSVK